MVAGRERVDGDDLLSHSVSAAVPSACQGLTSVFGMGTGGSPELSSPSKKGCEGVSEESAREAQSDFGEGQAERIISTGSLNTLLCVHIPPINQVVFLDPSGRAHLEGGFPLRCFQRLSLPHVATRQCRWRDNRNTRGASIPVLSY